MILAALIMRLHIHRRLIGLDVTTGQQLLAHGAYYWLEHLAASHYPAAHRRPADGHAGLAQENRALAVERTVVGIFAHDGVDDDLIGNQTLVDDSHRQRSGLHPLLFTLLLLASPLLPLGHFHVVLGPLHLENFALFVADHHGFVSAAPAHTLLRRAGNYLFHPGKIGRQRLPAGMRTPLPLFLVVSSRGQRLAFALCRNLLP